MVAIRKRFKTTPKTSRNAAAAATSTTHKRKSKQKLNPELFSLLFTATSAAHSFPLLNHIHLPPSPQPHSPPSLPPSQILNLESLLSSVSSHFPSPIPSSPSPSPSPSSFFFLSLYRFFPGRPPVVSLFPHVAASLQSSPVSCLPSSILFTPFMSSRFRPRFALFRLSLGGSYKCLSRRFGFPSAADAYHVYYTVCKAINAKLGKGSLGTIREEFWWVLGGFCCLIVVEYWFGKFDVDTERLGRNGSLLVQALVDSEGRFLHISAGWPCSKKPESILHQTKLFSGVEESRQLLNGPIYDLSDGNLVPQYMLRDVCFPLLPWLITPYVRNNEEDSFGSAENDFNAVHNRTMGLVHTAFGRVKARWQLLARRWKEECFQFFLFVIVTGCLPHNLLIKSNEPPPYNDEKEVELLIFEGELDENGRMIRDMLAKHLSRVSLRQ